MIKSKDSKQIKHLKKLKMKKYRDLHEEFIVFGDHLITEAIKSNSVAELYTSNPNKEGILISEQLMKELNETVTAFDQLALVKKTRKTIESDKILVLEDVQDPDNVGALLRSALAFGFNKVILSNKSADIYNDKTIRSSQGALFHLDIERTDVISALKDLKNKDYKVITTMLNGSSEFPKANKIALVMGNEGSGISSEVELLSDFKLTIKTSGVESLNVLVAGSILMYEGSKH